MAVNSYILKLLVLPKSATFLFVAMYSVSVCNAQTFSSESFDTIEPSFNSAALHIPPGFGSKSISKALHIPPGFGKGLHIPPGFGGGK